MAKSNLILPDGTKVNIEGTVEEVAILLQKISTNNKAKTIKTASEKNKKKTKKKSKKGGKTSYSIVKDLNLNPKSKKTFNEISEEKQPVSIKEKCVLCAYYLVNILKLRQIGIDHIYTCYKAMKWRLPTDLKNMLHQTANDGYLDTSNQNDIKITTIGENLIEHDLPRKRKSEK